MTQIVMIHAVLKYYKTVLVSFIFVICVRIVLFI